MVPRLNMNTKKSQSMNNTHTSNLPYFLANLGIQIDEFEYAKSELPRLVGISIGRILGMPFDLDTTFISLSGGVGSSVIKHITKVMPKASKYPSDKFPVLHFTNYELIHPRTKEFLYSSGIPILYSSMDNLDRERYKTQLSGFRFLSVPDDIPEINIWPSGPVYSSNANWINTVYPIYDWTDAQIWALIITEDLPFSDEYFIDRMHG